MATGTEDQERTPAEGVSSLLNHMGASIGAYFLNAGPPNPAKQRRPSSTPYSRRSRQLRRTGSDVSSPARSARQCPPSDAHATGTLAIWVRGADPNCQTSLEVDPMSQKRTSVVLGALPRTRPHRRSEKRSRVSDDRPAAEPAAAGARPANATRDANRARPARGKRLRQPAQPGGLPPDSRARKPPPPTGAEIVEITFRAAAELAEIGFVAGAQVFRNAVSRLPRP